MKTVLSVFAALCLTSAPLAAASHAEQAQATASIIGNDGAEIGMATLTQGPTGVLIHLRVEGLAPGKHGLHLHSVGECATDTDFKSAEGHVGKTDGGHGLLNPDGPEPGDLPNLFIGSDGIGELEAFTTLVSLGGSSDDLLDEDGSAFIIHEAADDHMTQPIGGAGGRVACGVVNSDS